LVAKEGLSFKEEKQICEYRPAQVSIYQNPGIVRFLIPVVNKPKDRQRLATYSYINRVENLVLPEPPVVGNYTKFVKSRYPQGVDNSASYPHITRSDGLTKLLFS
jgi:hypothetical protein